MFHQENHGAGFSRNKAISNSKGEYIIFVDCDDWIGEDMCEKLYYHAKKLDADLVVFNAVWHTPDGITEFNYFSDDEFNNDYKTFMFNYDFIKNKMWIASFGVIWSKFYKASFIKDNHIKFPHHKIYNDVEFHFKTVLLAKSIAYYPETFYHYIKLGQPSLQTTLREGVDELIWFDVLNGLYNMFNNDLRMNFINYCIYYTFDKLKNIDNEIQSLFLEEFKKFFSKLNPTYDELSSLSSVNSVGYTKKTLKLLPLFETVMYDGDEEAAFELLKYKLSEAKYDINSITSDGYTDLRKNFINMNIDSGLLKMLPRELSRFYITVLNFNSLESYNIIKDKSFNKSDFSESGVKFMEFDENIESDDLYINSQLKEKNIILSQTKAYLFDLENDLDIKNDIIKEKEDIIRKNNIEMEEIRKNFNKEKEDLIRKNSVEKEELRRKFNIEQEALIKKNNEKINELTINFNKEKDDLTNKYFSQISKIEGKDYRISTLESDVDNKEYEINYLKKNSFFKKLLSPLSYIYLLIKSKPNEFKTNIKLLKAFKEFGCFDVGYYLNNNGEVENSTVCRYFSPEIHYVIYGFENKYKFNKKYFNKKSKEELLNYIYYSKEPMP